MRRGGCQVRGEQAGGGSAAVRAGSSVLSSQLTQMLMVRLLVSRLSSSGNGAGSALQQVWHIRGPWYRGVHATVRRRRHRRPALRNLASLRALPGSLHA